MKYLAPLLLAPALMVSPATAQSASFGEETAKRAADILNDPVRQEQAASAVAAAMDVMMHMNVGPLAKAIGAIDPTSRARDIPANATLGDVVGANAGDTAALADEVRRNSQMMGTAAQLLGEYMPVISAMARDMAAQMGDEIRAASARSKSAAESGK